MFENIASPLRVSWHGRIRDRGPGRGSGRHPAAAANAETISARTLWWPAATNRPGARDRKGEHGDFLDEPLANLDYKLREELREQLPELLSGRGTIVVYATSEPTEALLLGGDFDA